MLRPSSNGVALAAVYDNGLLVPNGYLVELTHDGRLRLLCGVNVELGFPLDEYDRLRVSLSTPGDDQTCST